LAAREVSFAGPTVPPDVASAPSSTGQDFVDRFGKALGAVAGLAIVVYIVGGIGVYARLQRQALPPEAIVPEVPREQLVFLGLGQLFITTVLGFLLLWATRRMPGRLPDEGWDAWVQRVRTQKVFLALLAGAFVAILVLTPYSTNGLIAAMLLVGFVAWVLGWGWRVGPIVLVSVALAVAITYTVVRVSEFPPPYTTATVRLTAEAGQLVPEDQDGVVRARVLSVTDDEVLLGYESSEQRAREAETGVQMDLSLIRLPRDAVGEILYDAPRNPASFSESVTEHVFGAPNVMCIVPTCQAGSAGSHPDVRGRTLPFFQ
jgi:hypothetical protein